MPRLFYAFDSPGGSPSASETIRRALVKAQEKGKSVIISMGPVAASGGYWVATNADKIYASSGTITGSIGVVMGKFEAGDLFDTYGINWEGPQLGENADIFAIHEKFDAQGKARINSLIDSTYDAFLSRVAQGRNMTKAQAREVAQGRPWTGEQAMKIGLVDDLGGLDFALDETAKMLGKTSRHDLNVIRMPQELSPFEQILNLFGVEVGIGKFLNVNTDWVQKVQTFMSQMTFLNENTQTIYEPELEAFR